jgi:hypothetical protein
MPKARVESAISDIVLGEHDRLTFGRSRDCTVCLDAEDTAISRIAGTVEFAHGTWWIRNCSSTRPLSLVDDLGFRSVLPPGRRAAAEQQVQIIVDGSQGQHGLKVTTEVSRETGHGNQQPAGAPTAIGDEVLITPTDRIAMVALFAGYLRDPPRYDPHPKSYAAAAARLGWKRTTLVKRIEYLRLRLSAAGVPNMTGFTALSNLAEYAISRGLITRDDLSLLRS